MVQPAMAMMGGYMPLADVRLGGITINGQGKKQPSDSGMETGMDSQMMMGHDGDDDGDRRRSLEPDEEETCGVNGQFYTFEVEKDMRYRFRTIVSSSSPKTNLMNVWICRMNELTQKVCSLNMKCLVKLCCKKANRLLL